MKSIALIAMLWLTGSSLWGSIHTWHKIDVQQGRWQGRLAIIISNQGGYFANAAGNKIGANYDFIIDLNNPLKYGFGFDYNSTDFNVAYSVTLYQEDTFSNKACVFNVTAKGPAIPDIRINEYNGAKCSTSREEHHGTNFHIQ